MQHFQPIAAALLAAFLALAPAAASAQGQAPSSGAGEVVAFGDSLSAGYGVGPGESFPEQLQAALKAAGHDVTVANAGVSGDTSTGGLARLDWSVPDGTGLAILELGANDALRGIAPEITEKNLDAMLTRLKERGIKVLLAGMKAPPNMGPDYAARFDPIFPRLAEKHGVPLYPFFLEGVAAERTLNQADAMHPNKDGVAVIVKGIVPGVIAALGKDGAVAAP
ncbi:arylesterase [Mangrovicella endophytica]|uniref:arylesterase n=1 Tax=Mangrovicella endophytica TaxID=2066697 RepID=UPI000C9E7FE0|nr:arylesterase [Mangrovicella endophytica]